MRVLNAQGSEQAARACSFLVCVELTHRPFFLNSPQTLLNGESFHFNSHPERIAIVGQFYILQQGFAPLGAISGGK